eukprot:5640-Heterococcus_DN1.PRE.1
MELDYTIYTGIWLRHNAVYTICNSRTGITIGIDYKWSPADSSGGYAWLDGTKLSIRLQPNPD